MYSDILYCRHTPGSGPSRVTSQTPPSFRVTGFVISAAWAIRLAAVSEVTRWARQVTLRTIPAGLTGVTGAVNGGTDPAAFTETTTRHRTQTQRERVSSAANQVFQQTSLSYTSPTSFYSHCRTSPVHRPGCRRDPYTQDGKGTPRCLGHTCCV